MLVPYIKQLMRGQDLTANDSLLAGQILLNQAPKAQIAAFITLLATKGETVDELLGLVNAIKEQAINLNFDRPVLDIVGTGGDGAHTLNISTAAALLTASCGVPVVKHGNRAISSKCGSADVLEALGYPINLSPAELITSLNQINFGFCYAPNYHPVLASVKEVRNELKFPTIFNLLGPLLNPAGTEHLVLGVYDPQRVKLIAETLFKLGTKSSIVFHGNGLDELSCIGTIQALLVTATGIQELEINPFKLGLRPCTLTDIKGADANYNATLLSQTLSG
ncbi:MAG: anthranilate phosphoribosyltransferase, partial [Burkholderiales bacterium]